MNDEYRLVSREEVQVRFGLTPQFMKLWMEATDVKTRCPFILVGERGPMFHLPTFFAWLVRTFGQGNWRQENEPEEKPAVGRKGAA